MRVFVIALALAAAPVAAADPPKLADCASCHEEQATSFQNGPHGRAMAQRKGMLDASCVACHGPADAHLAEPQAGNITRVPEDSACTACHERDGHVPRLGARGHARNRVRCVDCHRPGHEPGKRAGDPLLRATTAELCGGCHQTEARAFAMPYAHRDGSRPFECGACHSVHGLGRGGRQALLGNAAVCADCHAEKAGPYVFPHAPREVTGCLSCHQPHGSPNPRLLTRRSVRDQCLECHADLPASHDVASPRYRQCLSCHTAVHGSNRDPNLFDV
jgi:DmsE family decaheme c-type cytochrome